MTKKRTIKALLLLMSIVYPIATVYPAAAPMEEVYASPSDINAYIADSDLPIDMDAACAPGYDLATDGAADKNSLNIEITEGISLKKINNAVDRYYEAGYTILVLVDIDDTITKKNPNFKNDLIPYLPVHTNNADFIREMQRMPDVIVLGFTARKIQDSDLAEATLQSVGVDYSLDAARFNFQAGPFYADPIENQGLGYKNGIIYCQRFNPENPDLDRMGAKDEALMLFVYANMQKINPYNNPLMIAIADDLLLSIAQGIHAIKEIKHVIKEMKKREALEETEQTEEETDIAAVLCKITAPDKMSALTTMLMMPQDESVVELEELIIKKLIQSKNGNCDELVELAAEGEFYAVKQLLDHGANPNFSSIQNDLGQTALMHAAVRDDISTMQLLLDAKADPACKDKHGFTALRFAQETIKNPESLSIITKLLS